MSFWDLFKKKSVTYKDVLNIPMDKHIEDFSKEEVKQMEESITIRKPDLFIEVYEKYYKNFDKDIYQYDEVNHVDTKTFKSLVNDIYLHQIAEQQKKNVKWDDIRNKYQNIPSEILENILSIESLRFLSRIHLYESEQLGIYWHYAPFIAPAWKGRYNLVPKTWFLSNDKTIEKWLPYYLTLSPSINIIYSLFEVEPIIKVFYKDTITEYNHYDFIEFIENNQLDYTFDKDMDLDLNPSLTEKYQEKGDTSITVDGLTRNQMQLKLLKRIYPKDYFKK